MNLQTVFIYSIINLLFPVLIAVLGTQIWNYILEKRKKEEEVYQKLYGPLKLNFSFIDSIDFHINNLVKIPYIQSRKNLAKIGKDESLSYYEYSVSNQMIEEWWQYVEKVKKLLEENSGFIKREHNPLVQNFIKGYVARENYGKIHYERNVPVHLHKYFNKEDEGFIKSVNELKEAILKD